MCLVSLDLKFYEFFFVREIGELPMILQPFYREIVALKLFWFIK